MCTKQISNWQKVEVYKLVGFVDYHSFFFLNTHLQGLNRWAGIGLISHLQLDTDQYIYCKLLHKESQF